ncbi:hypothetical protein O5D80_001758 [Batrachochytrium dendrobatidis]|nr:hypothetical protein O5D80_001758 [Batrachochytrium dendrobatidis]
MLKFLCLAVPLLTIMVNAQLALQPAPNCGLPADLKCLVTNAQYTVVGTVVSSTLNETGSSPTNYNATIAIRCVWASFTSPISPGAGLAGQQVLVANWGFPKQGCPSNTGSRANVGDNHIYFIYVAASAPNGQGPAQAIYAVQDICVGGAAYTQDNINTVASVLKQYPSNAIATENIGGASCALPSVSPSSNGGSANTGGNSAPSPVTVPNTASSIEGSITSIITAAALGLMSWFGL